MKKTLILASALLASLAFAGMVLAKVQPSDSSKPAQTAPAAPAKAQAPAAHRAAHASKPAAMSHTLSGKIVSVDAVANTVVVKTKKGEMTLNVDPAAKIRVGKETKLADLKSGSRITVSYKMEGENKVATRIW